MIMFYSQVLTTSLGFVGVLFFNIFFINFFIFILGDWQLLFLSSFY
jgi:hypothetical protein